MLLCEAWTPFNNKTYVLAEVRTANFDSSILKGLSKGRYKLKKKEKNRNPLHIVIQSL